MVTWNGLGRNPVPGDVAVVHRAGSDLGSVGEQAELLVGTLRRIDSGTGPAVWTGPAAASFRQLLAAVGPQLAELAGSYVSASAATTAYGVALSAAQEKACRAEADAERARADHSLAQRAHDQADAEARGWGATLRAAELRLAQAATLLLTPVALADPSYHSQLQVWQGQIADQRAHADTRRAEARGRQRAAESAMQDADFRLAVARGLADGAAGDVEQAASVLARALDVTTPDSRHGRRPSGWHSEVSPLTIVLGPDGQFLTVGGTAGGSLYEKSRSVDGRWGHGEASIEAGGAEISTDGKIGRFDDGTYGVGLGVGAAAYLVRAKAGGRLGNDQLAIEGSVSGQIGARAHLGTEVGFGKGKAQAGAGGEFFAGGEVDGKVAVDVGGVKPTLEAKAQYGIGGTAHVDVGYDNGKIEIKAKLGLTLGLGGEIDPSIEIDVPRLTKNIAGGIRSIEKSLSSIFD